MKRGAGGSKPRLDRKGPLSAEDHALWEHTAATLDPLRRGKQRVPAAAAPADTAAPRPRPEPLLAARGEAHAPPPPASRKGPISGTGHEPPQLASFERRHSRRIAKGQIAIDARLDLHGARQSEAYVRFRAFLVDCARQGIATVLVVTGKGGPRDTTAATPFDSPSAASQRGVLRRSVPLWLEEPDIRQIVISYTAASIQHGGAGALYIRLRKPRTARGSR